MAPNKGISKLIEFLAYYEAAHQNAPNRYVHHLSHLLAAIGILLLCRPLIGIPLIAMSFPLSWAGHYLLERNTPAFLEVPAVQQSGAPFTKAQVALGGLVWSGACLLRLFGRGPLIQEHNSK
jgi:hypothetical protein